MRSVSGSFTAVGGHRPLNRLSASNSAARATRSRAASQKVSNLPIATSKQARLPQTSSSHDSRTTAPLTSILSSLGVTTISQARDIAASLILAEAVYKVLDGASPADAVATISKAAAQLPEHLQQPLRLQWSLPHVTHRYLIAEGEESVYVAFMGTKARRDLVTNAAVLQELLWKEHRFSIEGEPAAHTGFIRRARSISIHGLLKIAEAKNKKLVLCGHSLGGAVAEICALDLLHSAPKDSPPNVQAIGFATPAVGNAALASLVKKRGWQRYLTNYLLPEDRIGGLLGFSPLPETSTTKGSNILLHSKENLTAKAPQTLFRDDRQDSGATTWQQSEGSQIRQPTAWSIQGSSQTASESNIVPFRRPAKELHQQPALVHKAAKSVVQAAGKVGLTSWAARFVYRALTFPLWAHKSFVPVSQRLYLNPQGVSSKPSAPAAAALAAASMPDALRASLAAEAAVQEAYGSSGASFQQRELIMWMHRLPSYRARLLQIGSGRLDVLQGPEVAKANRLSLANDAAPPVELRQAVALNPLRASGDLTPLRLLLEDCLKAARFRGPWPRHWQDLLDVCEDGVGTGARLRDLPSRFWVNVQSQLWGHSPKESHTTLLLRVNGKGLEHITGFKLALPCGQSFSAEVVERTDSPLWSCVDTKLKGTKAMSVFLAWLRLATLGGDDKTLQDNPGEGLLLRAVLPASSAAKDSLSPKGNLRLKYWTDFYEGSLAIRGVSIPQNKGRRRLVTSLKWPNTGSECFCNEC